MLGMSITAFAYLGKVPLHRLASEWIDQGPLGLMSGQKLRLAERDCGDAMMNLPACLQKLAI